MKSKARGPAAPKKTPTFAERLTEALEQGDLETAKRIAEEMAAGAAPPRKGTASASPPQKDPASASPPQKASRRPAKKPSAKEARPPQEVPQDVVAAPPGPSRLILPGQDDWTAPTRASGPSGPSSGGRRGVAARHESMQGRKFVNMFEDWAVAQERGFDGGSKIAKIDKKIVANARPVARPGNPGAARPPAVKVLTHCDGCGRSFEVYPSELMILDNESVYKCDRCIRRGK